MKYCRGDYPLQIDMDVPRFPEHTYHNMASLVCKGLPCTNHSMK